MKKLLTVLSLIFAMQFGFAQDDVPAGQPIPEQKKKEIEALRIAFISKELDLSPEDAQKFWPVFNQYNKEIQATLGDHDGDVIDREERVLNVRKKYREQFSKIIGADRMNRMFNADTKFRHMLIKMIQRQRQKQINRTNRQNFRNNQ